MGFQFTANNYILKPQFYNAIVEEIAPKATQFGPALVVKFGIMDNVPLTKAAREDDKFSLGKKVQKTFTATNTAPNGDLNFPPTGEYRNTVEMLVSTNNKDINAIAKDEKLLIGCVCQLVVLNSNPDKNGTIWNNIQKAGILAPTPETFALVAQYKVWKASQPAASQGVQYQGNAQAGYQPPQQPQYAPPQQPQYAPPQQPVNPNAAPATNQPANPAGGAALNDKGLFN